MMDHINVSILIPVYNSEKYLRECLDSVVNQTLRNIEIIIVNDGSTDQSPKIIDEFESRYEFIRVYHQENRGIEATRSRLLTLARGEYVGWVDSDDCVDSDMFEKLYTSAIEQNADVVLCDYEMFPATVKTKRKWYTPYQGVVDWTFIERNTQQWNKIIRRALLEKLKMSERFLSCGEGAYALALCKANGITSINEELYHYRVGHTSLSNNFNNVRWYTKNVGKTEKQQEAAIEMNLESNAGGGTLHIGSFIQYSKH